MEIRPERGDGTLAGVVYVFGEFELDPDTYELRRAGEPVRMEPQVFDVLHYLVRHRDRVVRKEELLDAVWGDRFVSESALTSRLKAARRAVDDDGQAQARIRTAHGRGYRFVAPVEVLDDAPASDEALAVEREAAAPVRYARADGLNVAYQVTGSGHLDLVLVAGFVSHLALDWTERRHAHFLRRLGTFSRLIRFDKRGTGMSDRPDDVPGLEERMADVTAVMGAARSERAVLFGYSEGGPMSILFAATYPERVSALVLYSTYARRLRAPDYPWGYRPEERARYAEDIERDWAWEADMRNMCPNADDELARWWGDRCRAASSPGAARRLVEMNSLVDVRGVLGAVQAPTLVLHRRDDRDSRVEEGRFIAERIPGARFVELPGRDHFVAVDPDQILDPVEEFVRSLVRVEGVAGDVALTTLLTVRVAEHIDPAWVEGLAMELVDEHRGEPGRADGAQVLATFDGPGRAVRCAVALAERAHDAGLHLAVGLHTAEVTRRGRRVEGDAVRVAQAIADRAPAGDVWATSTVRDLLAGSGVRFEDRGEVTTGATPPVVRVVAALV